MALGAISFGSGMFSGIDFRGIVDAIMNAERVPIRSIEKRIDGYKRSKSSLATLEEKLGELQSKLEGLKSNEKIGGKTVALSDENAPFSIEANSSAVAGEYEISVHDIARAHRVRSEGLDDSFSPLVSDGTITVQAGGHEEISVDVSALNGNNSLQAVADEINAADQGVIASIVNDGTHSILVLKSAESGTAHSLTISDTTNLNLADPTNQLQAATNASLTVDGIDVTSSTNTVSGAIAGVTINVRGTTSESVSASIDQDLESTKEAIREFVTAYNDVNDYFQNNFGSAASRERSSLTGLGSVMRLQSQLQSLVVGRVQGTAEGAIDSIAELGVTIADNTGRLEFSESEFDRLIEQDRFDEIAAVLQSRGTTSDGSVKFIAAVGSRAEAGTYDVQITEAAERAFVDGSTAITTLGQDETLSVTLGTETVDVLLSAGDDAATVVDKLNSAFDGAGLGVTAALESGALRLRSNDYGSAQTISALSNVADAGDGSTSGIGTTALNDTGVDVAGTIGGYAATGNGQELSGDEDTPVESLIVRVYATADSIAAKGGDFGTVGYSRGLMDTVIEEIERLSDPFDGLFHSINEGFDNRIENAEERVERLEMRLEMREESLVRQFSAAEAAIAQLQQMQASLAQQ